MKKYLRPGILILLSILIVITVASVKPNFYLAGWDNYSSYFRPDINMFRTLFSSWREYRGLGTPSDAEVTDVFRQAFYGVSRLVVPEQLLDQFYYLFALWVGVLGMYAFARLIVRDMVGLGEASARKQDLFAAIAAGLYLCNLNTLSVFYSPLIPFTNRFYSLPVTLFFVVRSFESKHRLRNFLVCAIVIIASSGSYITPTIVITSLIAFGLFVWTRYDFKKTVAFGVLFLCLNAFWVFPFINYTIQKSSIIPLARTFVEINESTLNRAASAFSPETQAILTPSFFDINFPSVTGASFTIHPLQKEYARGISTIIFSVFPVLYGLGCVLIVFYRKRNKKALWVPLWIMLFLFVSTKDFSPIGFVYSWMAQHIPLFDVIFRISDTKFHAYISLAGSIAAAYAVVTVLDAAHKKPLAYFVTGALIVVGVSYGWLFRGYGNGSLMGFYSYVQIPAAYRQIATVINREPGDGRVLHLPMDSWHYYWRSFSWGYLGSSFFHYFINKPYIDKTFEPASMENVYLHAKLTSLIASFYGATDPSQKSRIAANFLGILRNSGVQYVLVDGSISSSIYTRNILYSAIQSLSSAKEIVDYLAGQQAIERVNSFPIPLHDMYPAYRAMYPASVIGIPQDAPKQAVIDLYKVRDSAPTFRMLSTATNIDPNLDNVLETAWEQGGDHMTQDAGKPATLMPFIRQRHTMSASASGYALRYDLADPNAQTYRITTTQAAGDSAMIDVYAKASGGRLTLTFYHRYYPDINGHTFRRLVGDIQLALPQPVDAPSVAPAAFVTNWPQKKTDEVADAYRLKLNDLFLPVPAGLTGTPAYMTSYILHQDSIRAAILAKSAEQQLPLTSFTVTDPPSCVGPQGQGYNGIAKVVQGQLRLDVRGGSQCVTAPLPAPKAGNAYAYAELELLVKGLQSAPAARTGNSSVGNVLIQKGDNPVHGYLCVREGAIEECLNTHQNVRISDTPTRLRFPLESYISAASPLSARVGVVTIEGQTQTLILQDARTHVYRAQPEKSIPFVPIYPAESLMISGPVTILVPKAMSPYSYMHTPAQDLFYYPLESCRAGVTRQKTIRYMGDMIVNDMKDCSTYVAQNFTYAFGSPYLFAYEYWVGSGQQPSVVLGRKGEDTVNERASLYQGYPNIRKMRQFARPRLLDSSDRIWADLQAIELTSASRLIDPKYESDPYTTSGAIHVFQDTANEGVFAVRAFDLLEYPTTWYRMTLTPDGSTASYAASSPISYKRILPSLWQIDGRLGGGLVEFREGFDAQWGIYDSIWGMMVGRTVGTNVRCDGFTNCFSVGSRQATRYYVFYAPEKLAAAGWLVSFCTIGLAAIFIRRRSRRSS